MPAIHTGLRDTRSATGAVSISFRFAGCAAQRLTAGPPTSATSRSLRDRCERSNAGNFGSSKAMSPIAWKITARATSTCTSPIRTDSCSRSPRAATPGVRSDSRSARRVLQRWIAES
jgi:hypothetical protein